MDKNESSDEVKRIAYQPADCNRLLLAALENADIDASVALYEENAVLFKKSGNIMTGHDAIRQSNAALIALNPKFVIEFIKTTVSGDGTIASNRMKAKMEGRDENGKIIHGSIHTLEIVRRQADGSWRYILDDPYGSMRSELEER